ncbi:MAG TPA: hypothetical protein VLL56_09535, partial [Terriglobia bacterium]|nr:hypothetical protein [Terriglobia bacterium]
MVRKMKYARVAAWFLVARTLERATTRWQVTPPCAARGSCRREHLERDPGRWTVCPSRPDF